MNKDEKIRWLLKTIQERTHEIEELHRIKRDLILELEELERQKAPACGQGFSGVGARAKTI